MGCVRSGAGPQGSALGSTRRGFAAGVLINRWVEAVGKLTIAKIRSQKKPGWYGDGGTLYLCIAAGGSKSFVQRLTIDGMRYDLGLGGWPLTSLAEAREKAFANRKVARNGRDPRVGRRGTPTFREAAEKKHRELTPSWRNAKHAESWLQTLERHAFPVLGDRRVDRIRPRDVLAVLKPIWNERKETARRVRQRIRTVLAWCEGYEYVDRNVAGECIEGALHRQRDKQEHMRSLPYCDIAQLVRDLESGPGSLVNKLCLLFTILTATRGIEAREARWEEIDQEGRMWRIPGSRMKMERDHDQPLSEAAFEVVERAAGVRQWVRSGLSVPEQAPAAVEQRGVHESSEEAGVCRSRDCARVPRHVQDVGDRTHESPRACQEAEHRAPVREQDGREI